MTFSSLLIIQGGLQQPPLGKYVWEKPSGEQGLSNQFLRHFSLEIFDSKMLTFESKI